MAKLALNTKFFYFSLYEREKRTLQERESMADRAITDSSLKMDTKEPPPLNNLLQQAIAGSTTAQEELFQKLSARFLHLAQDIFCNRQAAVAVTNKALERVRTEYKKLFKHKNPCRRRRKCWTMKLKATFKG